METYYVIRQRGGWGVEHAGWVCSGHASRDTAIAAARRRAAEAELAGRPCRLAHPGRRRRLARGTQLRGFSVCV